MTKALFEGLVSDNYGNAVSVEYVGDDPTYVIIEDGFRYHVDAHRIDEQVLDFFRQQVDENKDMVSQGMLKMMGKDDLFSKVAVDKSLNDVDKTFAQLYEQGIPEQGRMLLGMLGFKVIIDRHGDILKLDMPAAADNGDSE